MCKHKLRCNTLPNKLLIHPAGHMNLPNHIYRQLVATVGGCLEHQAERIAAKEARASWDTTLKSTKNKQVDKQKKTIDPAAIRKRGGRESQIAQEEAAQSRLRTELTAIEARGGRLETPPPMLPSTVLDQMSRKSATCDTGLEGFWAPQSWVAKGVTVPLWGPLPAVLGSFTCWWGQHACQPA